jgi:hypothetical protein
LYVFFFASFIRVTCSIRLHPSRLFLKSISHVIRLDDILAVTSGLLYALNSGSCSLIEQCFLSWYWKCQIRNRKDSSLVAINWSWYSLLSSFP